jgi:hypothetical protein
MNKKFLGTLLIVIIVAVGILVYVGVGFAYANRYLWFPMSEEQLRQKVSDFYFPEISYEQCQLNNFRNFASLENCKDGIKCISDELGKIIPKSDLRRLIYNMKEGKMGESAVITYFEAHRDISQEYAKNGEAACATWLKK